VGLGKVNTIDSIEITWQGGKKEVIKNVPVNQYIRIEEGNGIVE
jgi:hypothetical protein